MRELKRQSRTSRWVALAAAISVTLALASCSSEASDGGTGGASAEAGSPASLVPSDVRERGFATIASDATYPPIGFFAEDGKTILGLDADLIHAMSKILDIELSEIPASFDSIIPGLQGGKYDFGMSWINHTDERQKVVDFVDYSEDGSSILVLADGDAQPEALADMCGLKVAVQKGTVQQTDVATQAKKCGSDGDKKLELQVFPDQTATNLAVLSGRADVTLADTPVAVFQQQNTKGKLKVSGVPYGSVLHGAAFPKGSKMAPAIAAAFAELMSNGSYQKILDKWDMGDAAIDEVLLNGEPLK